MLRRSTPIAQAIRSPAVRRAEAATGSVPSIAGGNGLTRADVLAPAPVRSMYAAADVRTACSLARGVSIAAIPDVEFAVRRSHCWMTLTIGTVNISDIEIVATT